MAYTIKGIPQLKARLDAITPNPDFMKRLAISAVREQKLMAPRKTSNLSRSIAPGTITATSAETVASANYAAFVEFGTRPHTIVPRFKKALRFPANSGSARLSGSPRTGGSVVFAKRVRHPGTRPKPFMVPGARKALANLGVDAIVKAWNDAA